jgi:hypothetical protein
VKNEIATPEKKALLEAFDSVLKRQAEARDEEARTAEARRLASSRTRPVFWAGAALALFIGAYLWVEKPEWMFSPPPAPESAAIKEASARIGVANAAQHVERFRQRAGRLPSTLTEAGAQVEGINYQRTGPDSWRIEGASGPVRVSLSSSESLPKFLGNSFQVISRRPR